MPRRNGETTTDSPRHLVPASANPVAPAVPVLSLAELGPLHGPWLLHGVEGFCPWPEPLFPAAATAIVAMSEVVN